MPNTIKITIRPDFHHDSIDQVYDWWDSQDEHYCLSIDNVEILEEEIEKYKVTMKPHPDAGNYIVEETSSGFLNGDWDVVNMSPTLEECVEFANTYHGSGKDCRIRKVEDFLVEYEHIENAKIVAKVTYHKE